MSIMITPATMVWAAAEDSNKLFHALSDWFTIETVNKIRLTLELANRQGNLKVQLAVRFCWAPTDNEVYGASPPAYAVPQEIGPSADADGLVVDTAAYALPSTNRAELAQIGVLAWKDGEPYDDLSVGQVQAKIEFLAR